MCRCDGGDDRVFEVGGAGMTYTTTVLDAYGVFNDAAWNAASAYHSGANTAGSAYSSAMRSANRTYAQSTFNAEKAHTMALFHAAKDESLANAKLDWDIAKANATATKVAASTATGVIDGLMALLGDLGPGYTYNNWLSDAQTTSTYFNHPTTGFLTTSNAARNTRITQGKTDLANGKAINNAAYNAKKDAANQKYQNDVNVAYVNYSVAAYSAYTTYVVSMNTLATTYNSTVETAFNTYAATEIIAWNKYVKQASRLNEAYHSVIARLGFDPSFDGAAHIQQIANTQANGGTGYEIQPVGGGTTGGSSGTSGQDDWYGFPPHPGLFPGPSNSCLDGCHGFNDYQYRIDVGPGFDINIPSGLLRNFFTGLYSLRKIVSPSNKDADYKNLFEEFLSGQGPRHRDFVPGDKMLEELRNHWWIEVGKQKALTALEEFCLGCHNGTFDDISHNYSYKDNKFRAPYDGFGGILQGEMTTPFLGTYSCRIKVKEIHLATGGFEVTLHFEVTNKTTNKSFQRDPITGYEPGYQGAPNYQSGPLSTITQRFSWDEKVFMNNKRCPICGM